MATVKTTHERGTTVFEVSWKDPGAVSTRVCQQDAAVLHDITDAIVPRKLSKRDRSRPWSLVLELSRDAVSEAGDLDEYFAGLADSLYRALLDLDPETDVPESIDVSWPASKHEGVYRAMTYEPAYDEDTVA